MKKEIFEELKRDPLYYLYKALNKENYDPDKKEKLERAIVLLEKMNRFEELFDLWETYWEMEIFNKDKPLEENCVYVLESLLRSLLTGYLKIYPLGEVDEVSGKTIHFRVNNIAYGSTPVYYQKVSYADPKNMVNLIKKVKPHSALRDLPTGETNESIS